MAARDDNKSVEDMLKAVNEAAGTARTIFITLMLLAVYFLIVAAGTDDLALLRNATVAVPTLSNATLPALAFYVCAPLVFVFMHLDLLIHFKLLSDKLHRFNEMLVHDRLLLREQRDFRLRLASFPFASWLGSDAARDRFHLRLQGMTVWVTLAVLPLLVLLGLQLGFLAYQSERITWMQRWTLIVDVGLLLYFWPQLLRSRYRDPPSPAGHFRTALLAWPVAVPGGLVLLIALPMATQPSEAADRWSQALYGGALDRAGLEAEFTALSRETCATIETVPATRSARCTALLSATPAPVAGSTACARLIAWLLPGVPFPFAADETGRSPEALLPRHLENANRLPERMKASCPTLALFHVKGTLLHRTLQVRDRVIATGEVKPELAMLLRQSLRAWSSCRDLDAFEADRCRTRAWAAFEDQRAQFETLDLSERSLLWADLAGSSLPKVQLTRARLDHANLAAADLRAAVLDHSWLIDADLGAATLVRAQGTGATLTAARLVAADLSRAVFDDALLDWTDLQQAQMAMVSLRRADLSGAELSWALLAGADLSGHARLTAATMIGVQMTGAHLIDADAVGIDMMAADLVGADAHNANLDLATTEQVDWKGALISEVPRSGVGFRKTVRPVMLVVHEPPEPSSRPLSEDRNQNLRRLTAVYDKGLALHLPQLADRLTRLKARIRLLPEQRQRNPMALSRCIGPKEPCKNKAIDDARERALEFARQICDAATADGLAGAQALAARLMDESIGWRHGLMPGALFSYSLNSEMDLTTVLSQAAKPALERLMRLDCHLPESIGVQLRQHQKAR